ncbi:MAG: arginase family protein [Alphaproteobacteria bacterium]|nr:arginase family protein [Alphaproteobacteria bacterium]
MSTLFGAPSGDEGQVVALGVAFAHGAARGGGVLHAPSTLRGLTASERLSEGILDYATDALVLSSLRLSDLGDLVHRASWPHRDFFDLVEATAVTLARQGKVVLGLGGDHAVSLPLARGVARAIGGLQVLQLDAHHDLAPLRPDSLPTHSNFVSFLARCPEVERVVQVGVRGYSSLRPEPTPGVVRSTVAGLAEALAPGVPVYLTVDSDAFDPSVLPAVRHPLPEGLTLGDLDRVLETVRRLDLPLVGADWTEYDVDLDPITLRSGQVVVFGLVRLLAALQRQLEGAG